MKKLLLLGGILFVWPAVVLADGKETGHMGDWGHMMSLWWGRGFLWILFLIVMVVVLYFILQSAKTKGLDGSSREILRETSIDILKRRYASGEISREEFEQIKRDIEG